MSQSESAHTTRSECVDAEQFVNEVDAIDGDIGNLTLEVSCPDCGREYEYNHRAVGVWHDNRKEYIDRDASELDWEWDNAYPGDTNYNVPVAGEEPLELVFELSTLADGNDIIHQF